MNWHQLLAQALAWLNAIVKTGTGFWGTVIAGAILLWKGADAAGNMDFVVQHWSAISAFLQSWGTLIGLSVAGALIAKAIYDTSDKFAAQPFDKGDVETDRELAEAEPNGDPVTFSVHGAWLNTAFACYPLGKNERGEPLYGEDLNLTVVAHKLLRDVRLMIQVKDTDETNPPIKYHHQGLISGTVTPGMRESLRIFRRTFCLVPVRVSTSDGRTVETQQRQDTGASFLEGLSEKSVALPGIYNIEITLHYPQGPQRCSFNLDLRSIEAPRSRLVFKRGVLDVRVPNNYAAPDFPPTVCGTSY